MSKTHIGIGFIAGVFVTALTWYALDTSDQKEFSAKISTSGAEVTSTGSGVDPIKVLEKILNDPDKKGGILSLLETKHNVFSINSLNLVAAIESKVCEPFPNTPLNLRLQKMQECANKPVIKALRQIAFDHKSPFHPVGSIGRMGVPRNMQNKPAEGFANVCKPGVYYGKKLQIRNQGNNEFIEIIANGTYSCPDITGNNFPDIQLNPTDAIKIFPNTKFASTEQVVIFPLE